jgi:hypothetical protein
MRVTRSAGGIEMVVGGRRDDKTVIWLCMQPHCINPIVHWSKQQSLLFLLPPSSTLTVHPFLSLHQLPRTVCPRLTSTLCQCWCVLGTWPLHQFTTQWLSLVKGATVYMDSFFILYSILAGHLWNRFYVWLGRPPASFICVILSVSFSVNATSVYLRLLLTELKLRGAEVLMGT